MYPSGRLFSKVGSRHLIGIAFLLPVIRTAQEKIVFKKSGTEKMVEGGLLALAFALFDFAVSKLRWFLLLPPKAGHKHRLWACSEIEKDGFHQRQNGLHPAPRLK